MSSYPTQNYPRTSFSGRLAAKLKKNVDKGFIYLYLDQRYPYQSYVVGFFYNKAKNTVGAFITAFNPQTASALTDIQTDEVKVNNFNTSININLDSSNEIH